MRRPRNRIPGTHVGSEEVNVMMHTGRPSASRAGFTLVELLVVIGMIAILAGILLPVLGSAKERSQVNADKVTLANLSTALGAYELDYQDYPPSTVDLVGIQGANPINQGSEVLVAVLSSSRKGSPYYEFSDDMLINTDDDRAKANLSAITGGYNKAELYEISDSFGNPFVYVHHRNYAKVGNAAKYRGEDGLDATIECQKSEKTGEWQGMGSFQMWGFGPNMLNENGGGDDVVGW